MEPLHLALWQTAHPADSTEALARLDRAAREAAAQGAHWLLTPEMFLTGYLIDAERLAAHAESADGLLLQSVRGIAQRHRTGIVTGWPQANGDAPPFNSAAAIDETGALLAVHRKIHLFGEGDTQRFTPGTAPPAVFEWRGWRLGLLICFDVEHDEPLRQLAEAGAHAVLVPTANMVGYDDVQHTRLPEAARRFSLAIAYANACGREGETVYNGLSMVCTREGQCLGKAARDEAVLRAAFTAPPSTPPARTRA
ncbi:MAG TPA: nitrilase-related carbon-nitrogen hydrolase [Hydrogenophaga sp.]|uniref:nitrilase-related carbon-nitrogen hydrolase n=1 Tax=Hydrogenophaga sp. TaxID=1904254 RepID=UPI002C86822C|nr:nitrilase-related carbon-nitrogen hydrolase [Hydrogenophaga sp.]HSX92380.1 nitrilase-related carbon-nitrogen hydrolase [Hydrogenophaga sp.]